MLMANYLQRFLFKWKFALLIMVITGMVVAAFSLQINRWLPNYCLSFSDLISQQFQAKISFRTAYYRFPDNIILKNVQVFSNDPAVPMLQASRVTIDLFNKIVINDMIIDFPVFKNYLALHGKNKYVWPKTLPKGKMHLLIPNGRFYLVDHTKGDPIPFDIDLELDKDHHLSVNGSWADRFDYEIDGDIYDSGFNLDKFTLKDGRSSINLWGSWHDNSVAWKGFIFYDKFYILDIDGNLEIQEKNVVLKQLSFSVNGDPVSASGDCLKQNPFQCNADIALKNLKLHLHSQNTSQGPVFKGSADLDFPFNPDSPTSLQSP